MNIDNLFKTTDLSELKEELNLLISNGATVGNIVKALVNKAVPITDNSDIYKNEHRDFASQVFTSEIEDGGSIKVKSELSTKAEDTFARLGSDNTINFRNPITVAKFYEYSDTNHKDYIKPLGEYKSADKVLNECIGQSRLQLAHEYYQIIDYILNQ